MVNHFWPGGSIESGCYLDTWIIINIIFVDVRAGAGVTRRVCADDERIFGIVVMSDQGSDAYIENENIFERSKYAAAAKSFPLYHHV